VNIIEKASNVSSPLQTERDTGLKPITMQGGTRGGVNSSSHGPPSKAGK